MSTHDGGKPKTRDVHNYCPPQGPSNIGDGHSPGLHGDNYGHGQMHHPKSEMGHAGIGGKDHGNDGSQIDHAPRGMGKGRPII